MNKTHLLLALCLGFCVCVFGQDGSGWKAGVARVKITPEKPIWLAGYAFRDHVSEGVRQDVWAKALALEDRDGNVGVVVTMDICFIPRDMSLAMKADIERKYGLKPGQVIFNASHTHSGPLVTLSKWVLYSLIDSEWEDVFAYTRVLMGKVSGVVGEALARREPAKVMTGGGTVRFAVNRRRNKESQITSTTELVGPVDHAVPVLKVEDAKGSLRAVLFGYACHNTVLGEYLVCGDFAGYAQEEVERMHPGATAMFFQGAGADQNPLPRRKVSLAMQYGRELAAAVEQTLADGMSPREPVLVTKYEETALAMEEPMSAATLQELSKRGDWVGRVACAMADEFSRKAPATEYPYPVQYWRVGDQKIFALGGEVVSGYSREIKKAHGGDSFVMGYCNDVMSYIPTPEMWDEGGYEVTSAHIVYMLPAPWRRDVTKRILDAVDRLVAADAAYACQSQWHRFLDPPAEYASFPRSVRKTATYERDGLRIECYEQANGPGTTQRVMLAMPADAKGRLPAVAAPFYFPEAMLGFNPTDGTKDAPNLVRSGTNLTFYSAITYMADLARRGYVTASADAYHLTYAKDGSPTNSWAKWGHVGSSLTRDWPGWTGIGKLAFDTRLLVDLLAAHERVDPSRIGVIGHSLGGKMAFYAGCLDPRIKVIVASDFGIGWDQTNWKDVWYWGDRLAEMRGAGRTNADLLSMSGGKPFCLIAGKYDNEESGRIMRSATGYASHPDWLKLVNHASGHRPPRAATVVGYEFLDRSLK